MNRFYHKLSRTVKTSAFVGCPKSITRTHPPTRAPEAVNVSVFNFVLFIITSQVTAVYICIYGLEDMTYSYLALYLVDYLQFHKVFHLLFLSLAELLICACVGFICSTVNKIFFYANEQSPFWITATGQCYINLLLCTCRKLPRISRLFF